MTLYTGAHDTHFPNGFMPTLANNKPGKGSEDTIERALDRMVRTSKC